MQFKVPELGEGVHEGELVKWKIKVGDVVADDQPLCEVMTDKATMEIPSPFSGKVTELHAKEGDTVHVDQVIISYEGGSGAVKSKSAPVVAPTAAPTPTPTPTPVSVSVPAPVSGAQMAAPPQIVHSSGNVTAAPSTRKFAREIGVDLNRVTGSGPSGRVMKEDVEKAARIGTTRTVRTGGEERVAFKGLRKKISEKMRLSKDKAAHFTYVEEADASELVKLRNQAKEIGAAQGIKVTYLPFIMKAMVAALRQYPILNSSLDEEKHELVYKHYFNIGISIQTDDGLTAPVVKGVEHKTVLELARELQDLVARARSKKLTLEDFQDGTITLTNAGSIGGLFATPVINYPEVAILGFNKIFRKPVAMVQNGREEIAIRDWTYFSISLDHRVVDGAIGAEFMKTFIRYIECPSLLLMEGF